MQIKKLAASILSCTMAAALLATGISPAPISMKSSAASSEFLYYRYILNALTIYCIIICQGIFIS